MTNSENVDRGGNPALWHDSDEFELFYRQHLDTVRHYLARRVNDPFIVADLTADVFLRAIHSALTYRCSLGPPRAWLIGIARNALADQRRRVARETAALHRFHGRELLDEESTDHIIDRIASQHDARHLLEAMRSLPESQRDVIELVVVDQLTLTEAARVLNIQAGAARVRYHRARRALRAQAADVEQEVTP
jgi:RNA polymerase sigma-70 factor (ECF subfamily)